MTEKLKEVLVTNLFRAIGVISALLFGACAWYMKEEAKTSKENQAHILDIKSDLIESKAQVGLNTKAIEDIRTSISEESQIRNKVETLTSE